ncbi:MAG: response regulator [Anaerolineales bacterium]|nr:response regulator [Anaerolineales bacterium]NOQ40727.1 response regulator [Anaerolineales bacterium]
MGRILFIDDDTDALETYVKAVSLANHKADVASSVQDGWEMIQETEYDLIFVDLNIPEVSGFELIEKLSLDENTKSIPVVVISALPEDGLIDEVLSAGAQLFLEKPVALVDLFAVIEKFETKSSK